ncbi:MAG: DUF3429 domain-containing protein [Limnobacter sp.]|nr:DUF3429 domain-containing protein [Limnobacter sp.]
MDKGLKTRWLEVLGYSGLIPFLGLALLVLLADTAEQAAQLSKLNLLYGACIVSFLGAVHWGILLTQASADHPSYLAGRTVAQHEAFSLIWGVTPSLIAWVIVGFASTTTALWLMGVALWFIWLVDQKALAPLQAFTDYLKLRTHLTLGASVGLFATAIFYSMV